MKLLMSWTLLAIPLLAQNALEVIAAYYGADRSFVDVTGIVRAQSLPEYVGLTVGADALGGDPFPGQLKTLRIYYKLSGQFQQGEWKDSEPVAIGRPNTAMRGGNRARPTRGAAGQLTILQAIYGSGSRTVDVTTLIQGRVQRNALEFDVPGAQLGDPAPGTSKELVVTYQYGGLVREARVRDGERLQLPQSSTTTQAPVAPMPVATGLKIISAQYGAGARIMDVTSLMTSRVAADQLSVPVDNVNMGGDPQRGADKVLSIVYEWNGQRFTDSAKEGQTMRLPSERALAVSPAAARLPIDGVCFYPGQNYQGTPVCAAWGQDQARVNGAFGSLRLLGTVRQVDLYESANYAGRSARVTSDLADLTRAGGGFFGTPATWAANLGSFRMSQ